MLSLIVFILVFIIFVSPLWVVVLLVERTNLRRQVKENLTTLGMTREDEVFSEGYRRALEDVEIAAKSSSSPLSALQAVDRLKTVEDKTGARVEGGIDIASTDEGELAATQEYSQMQDAPQDVSADIWGNTLDGPGEKTRVSQHRTENDEGVQMTEITPPPVSVKPDMSQQSVINVILFTGALLIVSAAAAFIATSTSPVLKALSMWVAVALFYGVGIWLYSRKNLRQVGVAFMGIGLALVPFAAVVLTVTMQIEAILSWLLASILAAVLSVHMLWLIRSEVAGYISIFSMISLAVAVSRNVSEDIFWIFVPIMLVGFGLQLLRQFSARPLADWVQRPVSVMSIVNPLVTLAVSIPYFSAIGYVKFEILLLIALVQFALYAVHLKSYAYELAVRALGTGLLGVVSAHIASLTGTSYVFMVGIGLSLAVILQVSLSIAWLRQRTEQVYQTEISLLPWYTGLAWAIAVVWYLSVTVMPFAAVVQLLIVIVMSYEVGKRLKKNSFRYSAITAIWLMPYALIELPQLLSVDSQAVLAWYYLAISAVLCVGYIIVSRRIKARSGKRWLMMVPMLMHVFSALAHSTSVELHSPLLISLVVFAVMMALFAVYERQAKLYIVSHSVILLASWRLMYEVFGTVESWMVGLVAIVVALLGWTIAEMASRRDGIKTAPDLYESALVMLGIGLIASWGYALTHDTWALLGVGAIVSGAGLVLYKSQIRKDSLLKELGFYVLTAAVLYTIFIADTAGQVLSPVYTLIAAAVASTFGFSGDSKDRRDTNFTVAYGLLVLGTVSSIGWGLAHDIDAYWGVGSLFVLTLLLLGRYKIERQSLWLEWAVYVCTGAALYSVAIVDTDALVPSMIYLIAIGASAVGAATISDSPDRRRSGYAAALIVFGFTFIISWSAAASHELSGLWGALALLAVAGVMSLQYRVTKKTQTVEIAVYTIASALCYGAFILDSTESIPFVVYLHAYVASLLGVALLYRDNQRELRFKLAAGLVTGVVGVNALAGVANYQFVFLVEHVVMLLLGALSARRWTMIWAAAAISVAVLYFLRDNSWLMLLLIGLLLVGFAVYRSTHNSSSKEN